MLLAWDPALMWELPLAALIGKFFIQHLLALPRLQMSFVWLSLTT